MDHNKKKKKKIKQLQKDYKIVFGSSKDNSHETAFLEGQRSVLLFIKAILNTKE